MGAAQASARDRKDVQGDSTFHEYASYWLQAKLEGIIGKKPISTSTHAGYLTSLKSHLLPFFGHYRLDEIDKDLCTEFKKHLIKEAHELREALAAGADLRDENNRKLVPLGPASIRGQLNLLGQIIEESVEDELITFNHARSKRLKVHVPKPKRTFLEMDELACVEDAAAEQDPSLERFPHAARETTDGSTAQAVAIRLSEGKRQRQIAAELGVAPGTVHFHVRNLGAVRVGVYVGRKAITCTLGRSGVRNGELSDIRIGHLRLHDAEGARLHIPDSKTETGIRVVEISPYLAEVLDHAHRPAAQRRQRHRTRGIPLPERTREPDDPQACRGSRPRGRRARHQEDERTRAAAASAHHPSQPPTYLYLDRATRQRIRPQVGHGPSRPRRFQDDARRLQPATAARQARARRILRPAHSRRARPALRRQAGAAGTAAALRREFGPTFGPTARKQPQDPSTTPAAAGSKPAD